MSHIEPFISCSDSVSKTQMKWLEVPIQKFNAAVPHFVELVKNHNINLTKVSLRKWQRCHCSTIESSFKVFINKV